MKCVRGRRRTIRKTLGVSPILMMATCYEMKNIFDSAPERNKIINEITGDHKSIFSTYPQDFYENHMGVVRETVS